MGKKTPTTPPEKPEVTTPAPQVAPPAPEPETVSTRKGGVIGKNKVTTDE